MFEWLHSQLKVTRVFVSSRLTGKLEEKRRGETRYARVGAGVIKKKRKKESERGRVCVCVCVCVVLCSKRVNVRSSKKSPSPIDDEETTERVSSVYIYIPRIEEADILFQDRRVRRSIDFSPAFN